MTTYGNMLQYVEWQLKTNETKVKTDLEKYSKLNESQCKHEHNIQTEEVTETIVYNVVKSVEQYLKTNGNIMMQQHSSPGIAADRIADKNDRTH